MPQSKLHNAHIEYYKPHLSDMVQDTFWQTSDKLASNGAGLVQPDADGSQCRVTWLSEDMVISLQASQRVRIRRAERASHRVWQDGEREREERGDRKKGRVRWENTPRRLTRHWLHCTAAKLSLVAAVRPAQAPSPPERLSRQTSFNQWKRDTPVLISTVCVLDTANWEPDQPVRHQTTSPSTV